MPSIEISKTLVRSYSSSAKTCATAHDFEPKHTSAKRLSILVTSIDQQKLYGMCSTTESSLENFIN